MNVFNSQNKFNQLKWVALKRADYSQTQLDCDFLVVSKLNENFVESIFCIFDGENF